jgi:hypothetical protein
MAISSATVFGCSVDIRWQDSQSQQGCIRGTVFDTGQNAVVAGFTVTLYDMKNRQIAQARSDAAGRYEINVVAGTYRIQGETNTFYAPLNLAPLHVRPGTRHILHLYLVVGGEILTSAEGDMASRSRFGLRFLSVGPLNESVLRYRDEHPLSSGGREFKAGPFLLFQMGFTQLRAERFILTVNQDLKSPILEGDGSVIVELDGDSHAADRFVFDVNSRSLVLERNGQPPFKLKLP